MAETDLTRLGSRKGLNKEHRDYELLTRLEAAIIRHAKGWDRFVVDIPNLLRQSIDEVIDASRSRRFVFSELQSTEKAYIGTKVEILLTNHLNLDRGELLDIRIEGIEVDIKNTIGENWMIPHEAIGHPCILIKTNEESAKCSFGLVVIKDDILTRSGNQDGKKSLTAAGKRTVHWMLDDYDYPKNFWEDVSKDAMKAITAPKGGTERLAVLFQTYQRSPIHRDVLIALAHQKDAMKRLRKNGGARDKLRHEEIAVLSGKYHGTLISRLGLKSCGPDEFISVKPVSLEEREMLQLAGEL